ncbi:hypothetical protein N7451_012509 [Penicillium sp. IBT 35674x]|nr:hypothetical protein N7451_012509 [Penicillium sp. IBT 35674x]
MNQRLGIKLLAPATFGCGSGSLVKFTLTGGIGFISYIGRDRINYIIGIVRVAGGAGIGITPGTLLGRWLGCCAILGKPISKPLQATSAPAECSCGQSRIRGIDATMPLLKKRITCLRPSAMLGRKLQILRSEDDVAVAELE